VRQPCCAGILIARLGFGADEAFAMLARASQARDVKLRVVAAQLVSEAASARSIGRPSPG